ncbi:hypothetical protein Tco_0322637 [Tanacetum coccineum]
MNLHQRYDSRKKLKSEYRNSAAPKASLLKPSSLVTPPPINTKATTITTSIPKITPFIALQLRVARLEQEMSEVKKTDHSADVLASIRSQVPTAIDKYLGIKLDDALLKNQESEKSPKKIIRIKREQGEEKQDSTYSIRSTDKVDLEEFDLNNEEAMIREVADKVKDHKRKHNSDDEKTMMMMKALQLESITRITTQEMLSWTLRCTELIPNQIIPEYNLQMTIPMQDDGNDLIWRDNDNAPTFPRCRLLTRRTTRSGNYSTIILLQQGSGLSSDRIPRREGSQIRIIRGRSQCDSVSRKDVKNLHLNDIEDLFLTQYSRSSPSLPKTDKTSLHTAVNMWIRNLVIKNHVGDLQLGIESYQTKINLERPNWDAADYYFKEDYMIVPKPRAVVYKTLIIKES